MNAAATAAAADTTATPAKAPAPEGSSSNHKAEDDSDEPAVESIDLNIDLNRSTGSLPVKEIQPTPKYTSNKPVGNPSSSSKNVLSGHFGR